LALGKPPKAGSVSPVPPPTQFANSGGDLKKSSAGSSSVKYSAQSQFTSRSFSASSQQQSKTSSSSSTTQQISSSQQSQQVKSSQYKTAPGSVRVLPALNQPVQLQEPNPDRPAGRDHVDKVSINSNEADQFIEQLMQEAETDPKLRELTYGQQSQHQHHQHKQQKQQQQQQQQQQKTQQQQSKPDLNESYPMIQRPYRTAQNIIIKDHEDSPPSRMTRPIERHKMPQRPYRTNEDLKIVQNRSKSADGRLHEAFKKQDPKLTNYNSQGSSSINVTEDLLNEVVTDQDHHCVKDLVAMMEKNTKTESLNPYVRKWGCDLISPEPHKKTVTYRQEKRQLVDKEQLQQSTMERSRTYTWKEDDLFRRKNNIDYNENMVVNYHEQHHSPSGRDDHNDYLDSHTAELDDLLGRRPSMDADQVDLEDNSRQMVVWPPSSPLPPMINDNQNYPSPMFSSSPPPPMMALPLPPPSPSPVPCVVANADQPAVSTLMPKKSNLKKRSQSEGDRTRRFSNSSLHEIDQQIVMIQNEFEAELDTLIDAYRNIHHTKKKG
jgi:hypothetical protein